MSRRPFHILLLLLAVTTAGMTEDTTYKTEPVVSFRAFDLHLDSSTDRLAAYQVEITYDKDTVKIVGIEGGETEAYNAAPFYDKAGFEGGRIIIAAFTVKEAPTGKTRVARIHTASETGDIPELKLKLLTAAKPGGKKFEPEVTLTKSKPLR